MDQAEPENQKLPGHITKHNTALSQIWLAMLFLLATNIAPDPTQLVRTT